MKKSDDFSSTDQAEISALRDRLRSGQLDSQDLLLIDRLLATLLSLITLLQHKNASISRLKRWLFGPGSDTRSTNKPKDSSASQPDKSSSPSSSPSNDSPNPFSQQPRPGHGRRPASDFKGAKLVNCTDPQLMPGDCCPQTGCRGHLYDTNSPAIFIRLIGQPVVGATRYQQQVLRCSACQQRYTAPLPDGVNAQKYDPTADVAIALTKYGAGLPFHRLAGLQASFGVPLASSVLFERCEAVADALLPIFLHLRGLAAQSSLIYTDDTRVKILCCLAENKFLSEGQRRGLQTTGIIARCGPHHIALFASGRRHAGENLDQLLRLRADGLPLPIQMGDALSRNFSGEFETIIAKCLAHARRQFVYIEANFPVECALVVDALGKVYSFDGQTKQMSAAERLAYHQQHSEPVLRELRQWIDQQFDQRLVEPNSALGKAFAYLVNHWEGLTRFLSQAGAPLDNNLVERALKMAVLHRKNALFYKSEHGAAVGDIVMSLIQTCRMNGVNEWEYLVWVLSHPSEARGQPGQSLPWNYQGQPVEQQIA